MHVTRFDQAPAYEAPRHFDMRCLRLQGKEAGPSEQMWMGMSQILPGPDCTSMAEVRAGVDALDRELVALLRRRFDYMDAAARIKPARGAVRDEARKAQVIAQACAEAERLSLPADAIAALWEHLVEASIAYELAAFDARG